MASEILILSDWFDPAYKAGGPIRSLMNITRVWPYRSSVFTSNLDLDDEGPLNNIESDTWIQKNENLQVYYQSLPHRKVSSLSKLFSERNWDAYYLNSLFSIWFSVVPLWILKRRGLSHKVVLAPRGMLHEGAFKQKFWKKRAFVLLAKSLGLWKGIHWHATSALEKDQILKVIGPQAKVIIFPNIPHIQPRAKFPKWSVENQRWLTVSRISPEKGILEGIEWLATSSIAQNVEWMIIGPIENLAYYQECLSKSDQFPHLKIQFLGEIPSEKIAAFRDDCHVYYSTTKGENFGHAIAEALLSGMPAIITNTTPWLDLSSMGVGWDVDWSEGGFHAAIAAWHRMNEEEYERMLYQLELFRSRWIVEEQARMDWSKMFPFL